MVVEIHGAGFYNKGAELMLRTVVSELRQRLPEFEPAIDPFYGSYIARCQLALRQIFPMRMHVGTGGFSKRFQKQKMFASLGGERLFRYIGNGHLGVYGCVSLSSVQGFIDISGFAYSDQWGAKPTQNLAEITRYFRSRKKPVILLPQAFGPFQRSETRAAFKRVLEDATLVFPRDEQSHRYALELLPEPGKIIRAPDITLFYPDVPFEVSPGRDDSYVCIVPNARMLDQGKAEWAEKYEMYLTLAAEEVIKQGLQVYLVVHETLGKDLEIAQRIFAKLGISNAVVVNENDPIVLKEIIRKSLVLVGSRYHSLVAALSGKVPVIAMGWAHKYDALLKDFACERFLISPEACIEDFLACVKSLINRNANLFQRRKIGERLEKMRTANQSMWEQVVSVLNCSSES